MSLIAAGANELHPPPLSLSFSDSIRSIRTTYAQTDGWTDWTMQSLSHAHEQSSFVLFVERGIHIGSFLSYFAEVFIHLNRLTRGSSQFRKLTAFCRKSRN